MFKIQDQCSIEDFEKCAAKIEQWSIGLWFDDFDMAGIENCYVAFDDEVPVGFQTINIDGRCVAIEVKEDYQGKGVASLLVERSGCWKPDRNENSDFWAAMENKYEY